MEFEALTGYSVSFLPSGSKPYQQHVTKPMFALPNYLKLKGYQTAAVHCFWAKYWSRDKAYPNLGFSDFISLEDMHGVTKVRKHYWTSGLVTDDSMADQIIQQYEKMSTSSDKPIFLHAVTMQNHTNYNRDNYPDDERVHVVSHPVGLKSSTVGALEDFATGIRDADAMLGKLTEYFSQVDEPVILVFWGDHYNPIDSNYDVFSKSGYASDSSADPRLHQTTLLMWSNYTDKPVDSSTGVMFESTLRKLSESEASMGFDYVFVNGKKSAVTVQIGIYDNEGTQLSLTEPIEVPLKRSHHTIMTGMFLMSEASGGVTINPDFDGDHNLIFP